MFIISMFCFSIQDTLGDPTREMAAMSMSDEERENLRDEMGLNDSLMVQYGRFVGRALQGDLGTSYFFKEPTLDVIMKKLPATLELVFAASFLIITISIPLGVFLRDQATPLVQPLHHGGQRYRHLDSGVFDRAGMILHILHHARLDALLRAR